MKIILLSFFILTNADAYILVFENYRLSKPDNTKVKISSEGCTGDIPHSDLKKAINRSIEMWNSAPESALKLKYGGTSNTSVASSTIPKGEVIIGCAALSGASGVTNHDRSNGSARIRLNSNEFGPGTYTDDGLAGIIMHELGHAIGLHHSKDPASVMTYEDNGWSPMPSYLSQDDIDGITYLYPNDKELGGLMGSCDSYASNSKHPGNNSGLFLGQFIWALGISMVLTYLFRKLYKLIQNHN